MMTQKKQIPQTISPTTCHEKSKKLLSPSHYRKGETELNNCTNLPLLPLIINILLKLNIVKCNPGNPKVGQKFESTRQWVVLLFKLRIWKFCHTRCLNKEGGIKVHARPFQYFTCYCETKLLDIFFLRYIFYISTFFVVVNYCGTCWSSSHMRRYITKI